MAGKFSLAELIAEGKVSNLGTKSREQIEYIDIGLIDSDPNNFYELSGLDELAANIELMGLQQPIRVRTSPDDPSRVVVVSGHRRRAAMQKLVDEGREDLREVPCIRDQSEGSAAMQELRLIYANSDTRRMTSAETSKQVERVEALLYQLKEEGYEFPGRMRDHVAEACKVSKSKLARLKVIREGLTPYFAKLYNDNVIGESVAYEIAKMPHYHKTFIEVHQDLLKVPVRNWAMSTAITYENRLAAIDKIECKGGGECTNRKGKYSASLKRQTWDCDTICAKCCSKCDKLVSCKYACPGLAGKIRRIKSDRKAQQEQEAIAQRKKQMPEIRKIQSYWDRFGKARSAADVDPKVCWDALGLSARYHGDADKVMAMERLEHEFSSLSDLPFGYVLRKDDAERMIKLADLLGCSLDYLLCRTDDPKGYAAPAVSAEPPQAVHAGVAWNPQTMDPPDGAKIVTIDRDGDADVGRYAAGTLQDSVFTSWDSVACWTMAPDRDSLAAPPAAEPPAEGWVPLKWLPGKELPQKDGQKAVAKFAVPDREEPLERIVVWDEFTRVWQFLHGAGAIECECVGWFPLPEEDKP